MSDPEGNSLFCFPESPEVSLDFVSGNIRTRRTTKQTGFLRDLTLSVLLHTCIYISRLWLQHQQKNNRANQNNRLGTYNNTNLILKTTEWMIYKVLPLYYLHLFPLLAAVSLVLCSFTKKKTGSVFPTFCHTTFHHALITRCNVSRSWYIAKCITIGIHLILVKATCGQ